MQNRTLYFGDNLEILREKFPDRPDGDGYFDLIYLDPPFNSNRDYNVLFKEGLADSAAQVQAFEDSWHWTRDAQKTFEELIGSRKSATRTNEQIANLMLALEKMVGHNDMLAYLTMMTARLIELHRVLKKTGGIYLHCDPTASHYLKIVMDAIFGKKNFRNEIVWCYRGAGYPKTDFGRRHDIILRYSKTDEYIFNLDAVREEYAKATKERFQHYIGNIRKGKDFGEQELHPLGRHPDDWWQIQPIAPSSKERLGYPTQKPEALLERIIKASSNEGDWVLDPFCGCGTTVSVAERLGRHWVGIDVTALAINLIKKRIKDQFPDKLAQIFVDGLPKDMAGAKALFKKDPFEFEYWALDLVSATPSGNKKRGSMRGADKGIDGIITFTRDMKNGIQEYGRLLVQVKGGGVGRSDIAALKGDMEREKTDGGLFITLEEPTRPMREEAVSAGSFQVPFNKEEFPRMQIISIKELLAHRGPRIPFGSPEPYHKKAKRVEPDMSKHQRGMEF